MPGPVIEEVNEEALMDAIKEQMKLQVRFRFLSFLRETIFFSILTIFLCCGAEGERCCC